LRAVLIARAFHEDGAGAGHVAWLAALEQAEQKVTILMKNPDGVVTEKIFDGGAENDA
jgi:hypothetical protein